MTNPRSHLKAVLLAAFMLALAACGSGDDPTGLLPLAEGDSPLISGTCAIGEPDCEDTVVLPDAGTELPPPGIDDPGSVSGGLVFDGGLTVSEALATDAGGVLAVAGHLFVDADGVRLCEELSPGGERYDCGGAHLAVDGLDVDEYSGMAIPHDGITYTPEPIIVFGALVDGVLVVDPMISG